jgi:hypothetical protein
MSVNSVNPFIIVVSLVSKLTGRSTNHSAVRRCFIPLTAPRRNTTKERYTYPNLASDPSFFSLKLQGSIDPIPDLSGYPPLKVWDTITQDVTLGQQCQAIVVMAHSNDKITRLIGEENNSLKALNVNVAKP